MKKKILPAVLTVLTAGIMCAASEVLQDREIIFPEIAALALGYLCAPKRAWQVNSVRMFLLISICALLGLSISVCVPLPLYLKTVLAFLIAQLIYLYSRTSLAPLISAVVLPVLIQSRSIAYVLSASGMTLLVILMHKLLVRLDLKQEEAYIPCSFPDGRRWQKMVIRTIVMAIVLWIGMRIGWPFMAAPPLLVAFTELSEKWRPDSSLKPVKTAVLLSLCAFSGSLCRYVLTICAGLPLSISAMAACGLMLAMVYHTQLFLPPAGAVALLAMLIPETAVILYPFEVLAGSSIYMAVSVGIYDIFHQKEVVQ